MLNYWKGQPADHRLILIGGGPEKNKYRRLIRELALTNVQILDFLPREKVFQYFRAADVYLFPSKEDIYGHVVNEALSQGLPVISNQNVNSAHHLIKNGEIGYVIDFNDEDKINMAIIDVLNNPEMANAALKTAGQNTIERMAKVHLDAFKDWMERR